MSIPTHQKIYHITHLTNIPLIIESGALYSEARCRSINQEMKKIGISEIKRRRLEEIEVYCNPGTKVGEYVPFYFCPRSIMLYIIYRGNNPDIPFRDGQDKIVHLEADFEETIAWAKEKRVPWAFSDTNAGARIAQFWNNAGNLDQVDWKAVNASDFRDPVMKEKKQAEFLFYDEFPLQLVERFAMMTDAVAGELEQILSGTDYRSRIAVKPEWYY